MKLSVGYQYSKNNDFLNCICENKSKISEVYFVFPNISNGRGIINYDLCELEYLKALENDLIYFSKENISLNLLLNGMCYGKDSLSRAFFLKIGDTIDYILKNFTLKSVTTTSPLIAKFIKENFAGLDVRASVNMEIGTVEGMDYIAEYFDSFYAKRELNRDFKALKKLRVWCDENNKKLYGLANSGCLNYCSVHTFHDNLVAHESEIVAMDNAYQFEGQCSIYLNDIEKRKKWLQISNFIRPEDMSIYENLFDGIKLATRVNKNPKRVLEAYLKQSFNGNLPEILEPDHSSLFYPFVVENKKIPKNFANIVTSCNKECESCDFCKNVLNGSLIKL